ncbi:group II intron reverse transcriptase/maturase [Salinispora arenicola]|uniref:group II intron reverse transcriptase/maturase n=1 Tax=Salinispora arenicola TaxID=168697 RepID=UPI00035E433D|nr:group II intron reverse transcriptase/maturase [Salinispora arenicola]
MRVFTASQAGDLKKVRNLQKLTLRSRANTLVSVRRVTECNTGRRTPGVDRMVVLTPEGKAELADGIQRHYRLWTPRPVRRVWIPKANGRRRGLGIPVIIDRVLQARVVNALEPEWEARFEAKSYGFRPGRGCHDAIGAIFAASSGQRTRRRWALDADLTAAFDRIDHSHLISQLGAFPARGIIGQWLTAGVIEHGEFTPTERGSPQGGVASPLLLNVALHGMEEAAGVRYAPTGWVRPGSPVLIRYADDLLALCHSREQAEQVKARLSTWLVPRGLGFNEDKTSIVHLDDGLDFLGFNIRRYDGKLLIKPSKAAVQRLRDRLRAEMRALRGANAAAVLHRLNPIIAGWAAYYRTVVSSRVFAGLDDYLWWLTYRWARRRHPNKPRRWVKARYFGTFNPFRNDRWVFGDRDTGFYLRRFTWTKIVRHQLVTGRASPDDPAQAAYWASRRRRRTPPLDGATLRLIQAQHGRCPLCRDLLLHADDEPQSPEQWQQWLTATRTAVRRQALTVDAGPGTPDEPAAIRLIHTHCHRRLTARAGSGPAARPA